MIRLLIPRSVVGNYPIRTLFSDNFGAYPWALNYFQVYSRSQFTGTFLLLRNRDFQKEFISRSFSRDSSKLNPSKFIHSLKNKIKWFDYSKSVLRAGGVKLYENIADRIRHEEFFQVLGLPDTLYSWFLVLELHVWMVMARVMAEKEGRFVRNIVVETMWEDVRIRIKKLQDDSITNISKNLEELSHQFGAAIIGYDEGLMSDDRCLAGALWRRILQQKYGSAASLEILVKYVREQMYMLDQLTSEEILIRPDLKWGSISLPKEHS